MNKVMLSDVIRKLQADLDEHGDMPVAIDNQARYAWLLQASDIDQVSGAGNDLNVLCGVQDAYPVDDDGYEFHYGESVNYIDEDEVEDFNEDLFTKVYMLAIAFE